jgi:hypothetical protein
VSEPEHLAALRPSGRAGIPPAMPANHEPSSFLAGARSGGRVAESANVTRYPGTRLFTLGIALAVLGYFVLALAEVGSESCHWIFPRWFGCVLTEHEGLAAGLIATGGALIAGWLAWTAVQYQIAAERERADEARSEAKRENERHQAEQVSGWMEDLPPGEGEWRNASQTDNAQYIQPASLQFDSFRRHGGRGVWGQFGLPQLLGADSAR